MRAKPKASAAAILDGWREQGADRVDRIGFWRIEALQRRAAAQDGEVRRLLDERLAGLIAAYADGLKSRAPRAETSPVAPVTSAMSGLIGYIAGQAAVSEVADDAASRPAFPELAALDDFRKIWAKTRVDSQLRQSLRPAPANAGPLNSGQLVHRSLNLMRELSPGYLRHFLAYVDALTWIEQMSDDGVVVFEETARAAPVGKRSRERSRKPRE
ncbi:MAG: DUF2894 domain-containing protein [Lysobacter sp.]